MRVAQACFILAGISAVLAAGMAGAQTYQGYYCSSTPAPVCMAQCGCPTDAVYNDLCVGNVPAMGANGASEIAYYSCYPSPQGTTCASTASSCGGLVYKCECWSCTCSWCITDQYGQCVDCTGTSCNWIPEKKESCKQNNGCM